MRERSEGERGVRGLLVSMCSDARSATRKKTESALGIIAGRRHPPRISINGGVGYHRVTGILGRWVCWAGRRPARQRGRWVSAAKFGRFDDPLRSKFRPRDNLDYAGSCSDLDYARF